MAANEFTPEAHANGLDEFCSGAMRRYSLEIYFCFRPTRHRVAQIHFKETAEVVVACG